MRIVNFKNGGTIRMGIQLPQGILDLEKAKLLFLKRSWSEVKALPTQSMALLDSVGDEWSLLTELVQRVEHDEMIRRLVVLPRESVRLAPPLLFPRKFFLLAGNYAEHLKEVGKEVPRETDLITPYVFWKPPTTTLIGDGDPVILSPLTVSVDWEIELAVIIGKRGKRISAHEAFDYIFGYSIVNDISERRLNSQLAGRKERPGDRWFDWLNGKWLDTFAPMGPAIVSRDEIPDPHRLQMKLYVNGQLEQSGSTAQMIIRIPEIVSYISQLVTLEPGDVISTGTPAGVGSASQRFLKPGDVLSAEIESIGALTNPIMSEKIPPSGKSNRETGKD